jgi:SAM-dependent methyltransferase
MDNYFIKKGYINNPVKSFDVAPDDNYWTPNRLKTSESLQFHVYEHAYTMFKKTKASSVLDIGCGPALKMKNFFLKETAGTDVVLMDQPSVKKLVNGIFPEATFFSVNLEDENFDVGKKFDLIICSDVIEHLSNPDCLLKIIKTHLSKTGIAVISTPDRDMRRGKANLRSPNPDHVREWNYQEFAAYLANHNFEILQHINLPSIRLNKFEMILNKLLYKKFRKATWYPCQTVVARLK